MFRAFALLLRKDFLCLSRTPALLFSSFGLAVLLVVVSSFSFRKLGYGQSEYLSMTPGILALVFLFSGVLFLNQSFLPEREHGAFRCIIGMKRAAGAAFFSKWCSNFIYLSLLQIVVVVVHALLFGAQMGSYLPYVLLLSLLYCVGFVALGTILSAMATISSEREVLLPLLLFPLLIPHTSAYVSTLHGLFEHGSVDFREFWFIFLCCFDVISLAVGWVLFDQVASD